MWYNPIVFKQKEADMKPCLILLVFLILSFGNVFAQESLTLTTYYPSPHGSYQELRVHGRLSIGDTNGDGVIDDDDLGQDAIGDPLNGSITVGTAVGIGTNTLDSELDITATDTEDGTATITLTSINPNTGGTNSTWTINNIGTNGTDGAGANEGDLQVRTTDDRGVTTTPVTIEQGADDDSLFIDSDGNVGIGMGGTSPQAKFDVNGEIKIGTTGLSCSSSTAGAIQYTTAAGLQYCDGTDWISGGSGTMHIASVDNFSIIRPGTIWIGDGNFVDITKESPPVEFISQDFTSQGGVVTFDYGAIFARRVNTVHCGGIVVEFILDGQVKSQIVSSDECPNCVDTAFKTYTTSALGAGSHNAKVRVWLWKTGCSRNANVGYIINNVSLHAFEM
jgi:hypothetical protein